MQRRTIHSEKIQSVCRYIKNLKYLHFFDREFDIVSIIGFKNSSFFLSII
jgi:hypothetical protein